MYCRSAQSFLLVHQSKSTNTSKVEKQPITKTSMIMEQFLNLYPVIFLTYYRFLNVHDSDERYQVNLLVVVSDIFHHQIKVICLFL